MKLKELAHFELIKLVAHGIPSESRCASPSTGVVQVEVELCGELSRSYLFSSLFCFSSHHLPQVSSEQISTRSCLKSVAA